MSNEKRKRALLLEQKDSLSTKRLVLVYCIGIILSNNQPEANVGKAIIPAKVNNLCYGCSDKYDLKVMSEFKLNLVLFRLHTTSVMEGRERE